MEHGSYPIQNQGKFQNCVEHSVSRTVGKIERVFTGKVNILCYGKTFDLAAARKKKIIENGELCPVDKLLRNMIVLDFQYVLPEQLRRNLQVKTYYKSHILSPDPVNPIKKALKESRHIIFEYQCPLRVHCAICPYDLVALKPEQLKVAFDKATPDDPIIGHAIVLFKWENGVLYFKNSYGKECGVFCMQQEILSLPFMAVCCNDLCVVDSFADEMRSRSNLFTSTFGCDLPKLQKVNSDCIRLENMYFGSGSESFVYEGTFNKKKKVAVKRIGALSDVRLVQMETNLFAFNHKNIVQLYAYKVEYDSNLTSALYVAMDRESCDLMDMYRHYATLYPNWTTLSGGPLGWGWIYFIMRDVAAAIKYLHSHHITHTDICMRNVVVSVTGVFKVIDVQSVSVEGSISSQWHAGHPGCYNGDPTLNNPYNRDMWCLASLLCYLLTSRYETNVNESDMPAIYHFVESCRQNCTYALPITVDAVCDDIDTERRCINGVECLYVGARDRGVIELANGHRKTVSKIREDIPYNKSFPVPQRLPSVSTMLGTFVLICLILLWNSPSVKEKRWNVWNHFGITLLSSFFSTVSLLKGTSVKDTSAAERKFRAVYTLIDTLHIDAMNKARGRRLDIFTYLNTTDSQIMKFAEYLIATGPYEQSKSWLQLLRSQRADNAHILDDLNADAHQTLKYAFMNSTGPVFGVNHNDSRSYCDNSDKDLILHFPLSEKYPEYFRYQDIVDGMECRVDLAGATGDRFIGSIDRSNHFHGSKNLSDMGMGCVAGINPYNFSVRVLLRGWHWLAWCNNGNKKWPVSVSCQVYTNGLWYAPEYAQNYVKTIVLAFAAEE